VEEKCQVVKECSIKSEGSSHGEHIEVTVYETQQREGAERLVEHDWIFLGEELLLDVLLTAAERLLVLGIDLDLELFSEVFVKNLANLWKAPFGSKVGLGIL